MRSNTASIAIEEASRAKRGDPNAKRTPMPDLATWRVNVDAPTTALAGQIVEGERQHRSGLDDQGFIG